MNAKASLIVPIHNGIEHLAIFWQSLLPLLDDRTELILIDDGSSQDTLSIFKSNQRRNLQFIRNERAQGFAHSVNKGMRAASGDYLFILNSDLIFHDNFIDAMIDRLDSDSSIGILGSKLVFPQSGRIQVFGVGFTKTNHFHLFKNSESDNPLISSKLRFQAAVFAAVCIPRRIQQEVGYLDENYFNGYEDLDYSFRVREKGYEIAYETNSSIYHWRLQSGFGRDSLRKENITRLWGRWGRQIESDLKLFFRNSILQAKSDATLSRDVSYDLVILSKGSEWQSLASIIKQELTITNTYTFNYRNKPNDSLWLAQILPPDFIRIAKPIIYLIDEAPMLNQNHYWFKQRNRFGQNLVLDHVGNLIQH